MAAAPLGGAGAAAPAQAVNGGAPIHPDLEYDDYFQAFSSWMFNGYMDVYYYNYKPEVHDPMLKELEDTDHDIDEEAKVHKKYITHFFGKHPRGAQRALKEYLEWLTYSDTLTRRGLGEYWDAYGPESVRPFIKAYLDNGAKLEPLREFINNIGNVPNDNNNNEYGNKNKLELKKALLKELEAERKAAAAAEAALPLLPASPPNSPRSNNNQGGGRRRKSRKLLRKTRRATRRRSSRRNY